MNVFAFAMIPRFRLFTRYGADRVQKNEPRGENVCGIVRFRETKRWAPSWRNGSNARPIGRSMGILRGVKKWQENCKDKLQPKKILHLFFSLFG